MVSTGLSDTPVEQRIYYSASKHVMEYPCIHLCRDVNARAGKAGRAPFSTAGEKHGAIMLTFCRLHLLLSTSF